MTPALLLVAAGCLAAAGPLPHAGTTGPVREEAEPGAKPPPSLNWLEEVQVWIVREVVPLAPTEKGRLLSRFLKKGMTQEAVRGILGSPMAIQGFGPPGGGVRIYDYWEYELSVMFQEGKNGDFLVDVTPHGRDDPAEEAKAAIPALTKALQDSDPDVREVAEDALKAIQQAEDALKAVQRAKDAPGAGE
jgi:hypothetical protein